MGGFWLTAAAYVVQDRYFTREGRLHPITRWILYHRQSINEQEEELVRLIRDARGRGEEFVFVQ